MTLEDCTAHARPDEHVGLEIVAGPGTLWAFLVLIVMHGPDKAEMKMRLPGHVFDDAGHLAKGMVLQFNRLPDHVGPVKITSGHRFVDDDGVWLVERRIGVALDHGYGEDLEESGDGQDEVVVLDKVVSLLHHDIASPIDPRHLLDIGIVFDHRRPHRSWRNGGGKKRVIEKQ